MKRRPSARVSRRGLCRASAWPGRSRPPAAAGDPEDGGGQGVRPARARGASGSGMAIARPGPRRSSCPVLDLKTEAGGLTPLRAGRRTSRPRASPSRERTVVVHLPQAAEAPGADAAQGMAGHALERIAIDQTAAAHPAATVIVGALAQRRRDPVLRVAPGGDAGRSGPRKVPEDVREHGRDVRRVLGARLPGHHRDHLLRRPVEEVARGRSGDPGRQPRVPEGPAVRPRGRATGTVTRASGAGPASPASRSGSRCPRTPTRPSRATRARRSPRSRTSFRASCATRASTRSGSRG